MIGIAAIGVGVLCAAGVYLMLSRDVQLLSMGFFLLSNGVNLLVLTAAGMPAGAAPPLIQVSAPAGPTADPLAQAFILTAIVIGFGMAAFLLAMAIDMHADQRGDRASGGDEA
jgi:multicomponent Na+:H+ antiporter subunit C